MILGLALVAVAVVALVIVNAGGGTGGTTSFGHSSDTPKDRYYVVRAGDTFATIAAKEGVSLARIERLNPSHPNSIQPGNCVDLIRHGCRELAVHSSGRPLGFHHLP